MKSPLAHASGVMFFLPATVGQRLCVYHAPPPNEPVRAAMLYVPPFGDEMNKSRRMAAMQARAFARNGIAVLLIDLYGCGDSSGDFADARWEIWKDDLALAHTWLADHSDARVMLWGTRLGALLALDYARQAVRPVNRFLFWQPVLSGEIYMTRILRIRLANEMLGAESGGVGTDIDEAQHAGSRSTSKLREALRQGQSLEVAGYEIAPALANAIDTASAAGLAPVGATVDWFEIVAEPGRTVPPASLAMVRGWKDEDVDLRTHCLTGAPFWSTPEIAECAALIAASLDAFTFDFSCSQSR